MTSGISNSERQLEIQTRLILTEFVEKYDETRFRTVFASEQLYSATLYHIKEAQKMAFDDYAVLAKNEPIKESSKLAKL